MKLTVHKCTKVKDGYRITLMSDEKLVKGTPIICVEDKQEMNLIDAINRVFGLTKEELQNKRSDFKHTDARKVYSKIRHDLGYSVTQIALELKKHSASVNYYLSDNSERIQNFKKSVLEWMTSLQN